MVPNFIYACAEDPNNRFELELLTYQEQRSNYLYQLLIDSGERDYQELTNPIQDELIILEAKIETTRKGVKVHYFGFRHYLLQYI